MSTPGGDITHGEQDVVGYEISVDADDLAAMRNQQLQQRPEQEEDSLADQYRGTPPLKTKKKKHRHSHEIQEPQVNLQVLSFSARSFRVTSSPDLDLLNVHLSMAMSFPAEFHQ